MSSKIIYSRLEDMFEQLEKSWPENLQKIVNSDPFPGNEYFFIYTISKWDNRSQPRKYNISHHPRISMPDPVWGTSLRKVWTVGKSEIVWCLPHEEGQKHYSKGKMFENEFVHNCIVKMITGEFQRIVDEYNEDDKNFR